MLLKYRLVKIRRQLHQLQHHLNRLKDQSPIDQFYPGRDRFWILLSTQLSAMDLTGAFRCCYCGFHNPARRNRRHPQALKFPTSPDSPFNQPTPLSASYERPQYSSALNLTSVGSRSHLNRGPFERISASTENVLSSSFIESSALPPRSSKRCRTVAATQRNPASRSASACSLTTSPLLPEEESEKDPSEKSEEGES
ncbi:unnamed protein product [Hymenolepis diminuta]|uniref:Uncharacterized protein n=1 Tax=Hymenolepis diminuta TaxID=6216 RepID=A0A564YQ35_HYMDI|nr:unnamed protein product [Hymenolepis diminuta]